MPFHLNIEILRPFFGYILAFFQIGTNIEWTFVSIVRPPGRTTMFAAEQVRKACGDVWVVS
jgi:hypothetical protein